MQDDLTNVLFLIHYDLVVLVVLIGSLVAALVAHIWFGR